MPSGRVKMPPLEPIDRGDGTFAIPLAGKAGAGRSAIVDAEDLEKVRHLRWHASSVRGKTVYAQANVRGQDGKMTTVQMHLLIVKSLDEVDHEDGDGLNNRRTNLRACTQGQNKQNQRVHTTTHSTGFKGVVRHQDGGYVVSVGTGRRGGKKYLGYFKDVVEAAKCYDAATRERCGEFARLNFPQPGEQSARY